MRTYFGFSEMISLVRRYTYSWSSKEYISVFQKGGGFWIFRNMFLLGGVFLAQDIPSALKRSPAGAGPVHMGCRGGLLWEYLPHCLGCRLSHGAASQFGGDWRYRYSSALPPRTRPLLHTRGRAYPYVQRGRTHAIRGAQRVSRVRTV